MAGSLQPDDSGPLTDYLVSKASAIEGFVEGTLYFPDRDADTLQNTEKIQEQATDTFEMGYKGLWGDRLMVGIDGYYTIKSGTIFTQVITPFVTIPGSILSQNLEKAVLEAFTDEELKPLGIDAATLASVYAQEGSAMGNRLLGIVEPDQNYNPDTPPELLLANVNAGTPRVHRISHHREDGDFAADLPILTEIHPPAGC